MIIDLKPYPAYKDSGVPWLGHIPGHWDLHRTKTLLRERSEKGFADEPLLAATQTKGVVRKELYENRTVLALKDLHLLKLVRSGDFVISLRSFQGGIEYAREQGIISPAYTILYPVNRSHHDYLAWLFKSKPFIENLTLFVTGIRQGQNIDYAKLSRSYLPLPPIEEQTAVTRYLTYIDRRIRKYIRAKQKLIKLLEEQKQAIIHTAVTRGLDPHVPLKPSGIDWLGDIPAHWDMISAGAATSLMQTGPFGSQLHSYEYITDGIPVVNPSHMKNGRIEPDSDITVSVSKLEELARHQLRKGDIVAARRGELGRCALVTSVEEGWLCGTGSLLIRCKPSVFFPAYFQIVFSSQGIHDSLSLASVGATMDNLNTGMVARLRMPLPPYSEQLQIVKQVENVKRQCALAISSINKEIELVREYRTRLIADVVTGKLDVRAAAAALPLEPEENDIPEVDDDTVEDAELADAFDASDDADD